MKHNSLKEFFLKKMTHDEEMPFQSSVQNQNVEPIIEKRENFHKNFGPDFISYLTEDDQKLKRCNEFTSGSLLEKAVNSEIQSII